MCPRGEMDITLAFEASIGGSNPPGGERSRDMEHADCLMCVKI